MSICIGCLGDVQHKHKRLCCIGKCINANKYICQYCYNTWPFKYIFDEVLYENSVSLCSVKCIINYRGLLMREFKNVPTILLEHQEEILHTSRKPMIKLLIKELNYFIEDILNEIMEY